MHRAPRRLFIKRRIEQLLDPRRIEILRVTVPRRAHRPDASSLDRPRRFLALHHDVARDRLAVCRGVVAHEHRLPGARGGGSDLREPEIGRPAMPVAGCGHDVPVRRDQRKLAVEGLLRSEDYTQGRTLPRRHRRGEHGESRLVLAGGGWGLHLRLRFGLGFRRMLGSKSCGGDAKTPHSDQQGCDRSNGKLAWRQQSNPRPILPVVENTLKLGRKNGKLHAFKRTAKMKAVCRFWSRACKYGRLGVAMWSRLPLALACALLLLPAQALAGAKEKVAALAPSGLVLVVDDKGNELIAQNADKPFVPASVTKIVTAWLAMEVLGGDYRFETKFYLDKDRVLYVRGGGDPFLISEELAKLGQA